jgi:hypothetical protein
MRLGRSILLAAFTVAAGSAHAGGAGVRIGTTGLGADVGWDIAPTLGGRLGISAGSWKTDFNTSDVNYDAKLKLGNVNAFLDWSPLGPFRITGGVIANNNKIDLTGTSPGVDATVSGTVKPSNSWAPYLGVGYGNVWTRGVNFYFDVGVMYMGSPKATLSVSCGPTASPAQCAAAQSQVAAEQARVEDELKRFKYYPVANIGITIGF